jgi:hypothetical protein
MHLPQLMHFSLSMVGAALPSCVMASTGQMRIAGQRWFCGHLFDSTIIIIILLLHQQSVYTFLYPYGVFTNNPLGDFAKEFNHNFYKVSIVFI